MRVQIIEGHFALLKGCAVTLIHGPIPAGYAAHLVTLDALPRYPMRFESREFIQLKDSDEPV